MQIVIEISEEDYRETINDESDCGLCPLSQAIKKGTPLPEHHRLIEADRLKEELDYYIREAGWSDDHNEALTWCKEFIDHAETIIPATKEGDEE